uniref:peptidylprolyl isomerase n=1 Tax=Tanacetum cinerariifolium TaxID=118510 RepID=A0A6L2KFE2_TANCI|nr:peptidyl-prolyl cis-trans isomerase FKBP17-1, chloroplastic [Tanacetum cinerariifolium]
MVTTRRRLLSLLAVTAFSAPLEAVAVAETPRFSELAESGGVKVLDIRVGTGIESPVNGDQVAIHYYGRLAAKQGWRFDSTYDHKDETVPFIFTLGSGKVIAGIESAVKSMKVGGIRRVIIPPSQGYQNMDQEPIPPNYFDRQRLFTTIFNPTRLANGEGSTLGIIIFDIELIQSC